MTTLRQRPWARALLLLTFGLLAVLPAATMPTTTAAAGAGSPAAGVAAAPPPTATVPAGAVAEAATLAAVASDLTADRVASSQPGQPGFGPPRFGWPLPGRPSVARPFTAPPSPYGPGHRGVDLTARPGTPVRAASAGVVVFAGQLAGRGVVSIDHDILRTTYEPLTPAVTAGDQVYAGQRIGTLAPGHDGCAPACLHWGVRRGTAPPEYLSPLPLLAAHTALRLKPWPD